jgi:hypothetical protein
MRHLPDPIIDENRYRKEVLLLPNKETQEDVERRLRDEARELGLDVSTIEIAASIAASISTGGLQFSSPCYLERPSIELGTLLDYNPSRRTSMNLDPLEVSVSQMSLSSTKVDSNGLLSAASPVGPTSCDPCGDTTLHIDDRPPSRRDAHRGSTGSITLPGSGKRKSLIGALGLPFRKRRPASISVLSSRTQVTMKRYPDGALIEASSGSNSATASSKERVMLKVEVPVHDEAALQRSLGSLELRRMRELHEAEISRHIALQNQLMLSLREQRHDIVANRRLANEHSEKEKCEQVSLSSSASNICVRRLVSPTLYTCRISQLLPGWRSVTSPLK